MTTVYCTGLGNVNSLQHELDQLFQSFNTVPTAQPGRLYFGEDADNLYVEAVIPGVTPADISAEVKEDVLTIGVGDHRHETVSPEIKWHRRERATAAFQKSIELPKAVDKDHIKAEYKNGILLLTLPKAPEVKPRQISINS